MRPKLLGPAVMIIAGLATVAVAAVSLANTRTGSAATGPSVLRQLHGRDPLTGRQVRPAAFAGRAVLVELWASACSACVQTANTIERVARGHPAAAVLAIDVGDDARRARTLAKRYGWRAPSIRDTRAQIADVLAVRSLPTTLVLDRDGCVAARFSGSVRARSLASGLTDAERHGCSPG